jgi:hypothetical protein
MRKLKAVNRTRPYSPARSIFFSFSFTGWYLRDGDEMANRKELAWPLIPSLFWGKRVVHVHKKCGGLWYVHMLMYSAIAIRK